SFRGPSGPRNPYRFCHSEDLQIRGISTPWLLDLSFQESVFLPFHDASLSLVSPKTKIPSISGRDLKPLAGPEISLYVPLLKIVTDLDEFSANFPNFIFEIMHLTHN